MAIAPLPHPTPAGVVAAACTEVASQRGVLWAARPSAELVAGVEELQRLKAAAGALEAELLAELVVRDTAKQELGWGVDCRLVHPPGRRHPAAGQTDGSSTPGC